MPIKNVLLSGQNNQLSLSPTQVTKTNLNQSKPNQALILCQAAQKRRARLFVEKRERERAPEQKNRKIPTSQAIILQINRDMVDVQPYIRPPFRSIPLLSPDPVEMIQFEPRSARESKARYFHHRFPHFTSNYSTSSPHHMLSHPIPSHLTSHPHPSHQYS